MMHATQTKGNEMKMTQEYDGSICIHNQVVGKFEIDGFSYEQNRVLNDEIVKRWNAFEDKKLTAFKGDEFKHAANLRATKDAIKVAAKTGKPTNVIGWM